MVEVVVEKTQQGFAKHCGEEDMLRGRGEAVPRHVGVSLPSLSLSIYRGRGEVEAPLGFPLGGGGHKGEGGG